MMMDGSGPGVPGMDEGAARAEAAEARLDEIVYRLSHDLQAPVLAIRTIPDWLAEDLAEAGIDLPAPAAENIGMLKRQAARLSGMIDGLLIYSRVGRSTAPEPVDIDALARSLLGEMPGAAGFRLDLDTDAATPACGAQDLVYLLGALLSNAVKHHPAPPGRIRVATRAENGACVLEVSDDGSGIPEPDRDRALAFMMTLRARDEVEGAGMGLTVAARMAEVYGGRLEIRDGPEGRGCLVRAVLPAAAG